MASSQTEGVIQPECLSMHASDAAPMRGGFKPTSPIARQPSIYSLTLDEFHNAHGEPTKNFGSMNMDEFLRNIWTAEESQAMAAAMEGGLNTEESQLLPFQQGMQRQASISLPRTLSRKTVDDVWKDILRGDSLNMNSEATVGMQERQITFGEMTLEDFLVKAGVVKKEETGNTTNVASPSISFGKSFTVASNGIPDEKLASDNLSFGVMDVVDGEIAQGSSLPTLSMSSPRMHVNKQGFEPMKIDHGNHSPSSMSQSDWISNATLQVEVPYSDGRLNALHRHAAEANGRKAGMLNEPIMRGAGMLGPDLGMGLAERCAITQCNSPASLALKRGSPQSPLLDPSVPSFDAMVMPSPIPYGVEGGVTRGRKREYEGSLEKVVERRQKRMIKNRESAARSRARKQAYTVELEAEVSQLKEENLRLRLYEEEMAELRKRKLIDVLMSFGSHFAPKPCKLRRTHTGPW
ncbi:hypothetical protein KP509_19G009600 [Ceratopteris richardii]|uniref:BZIP domain-containing protein n=1 Tax=Ceratopteris richardii TaxID=49495 RepID=A0A8T2SJM7_CERRI|nr:hypothetical protein KP509_19G009600 [Ceratopteris richardii]